MEYSDMYPYRDIPRYLFLKYATLQVLWTDQQCITISYPIYRAVYKLPNKQSSVYKLPNKQSSV